MWASVVLPHPAILKTTIALAKAIKEGKRCRINIWSGASVGPEIEEELAAVGAIKGRMPYYAASNKSMKRALMKARLNMWTNI